MAKNEKIKRMNKIIDSYTVEKNKLAFFFHSRIKKKKKKFLEKQTRR